MEKKDLKFLTSESGQVAGSYSEFVLQAFSQLRGREQECLQLVELVDQVRLKWKESAELHILAEERCRRVEEEKEKLRDEYERLREMYHDSKAKVSSLLGAKDDLQNQLRDYEQRVKSIRTLIEKELKDTAAFGQLLSLSALEAQRGQGTSRSRSNDYGLDVDFDCTNEDEDVDEVHLRYNRTYQRRSKSVDPDQRRTQQAAMVTKRSRSRQIHENIAEEDEEVESVPTPPKRSRDMSHHEEQITTVTTITMDARGRQPTRASVEVHRGQKRSVSESRAFEPPSGTPMSARSIRMGASTTDLRSPLTAFGSSWTKGRPILECTHYFDQAKGALMKSCVVCNRTVTMQNVAKCKDCNIYLHTACKDRAPMPCLPFMNDKSKKQTPQKGKRPLRLADMCPSSPPLVPATLIRLIYEIERRVEQEGLYRIPGSKDAVERLLAAMGSSVIPQLQLEHTEVLTSAVVKFLGRLREPLIPTTSYNEFVQAVRDSGNERLMQAIADLPLPNRDTLAFLCVHLQKVSRHAHENKMPIGNLAKCVGVTVFQGLRRDMISTLDMQANPHSEAAKQRDAMERLLQLPEEYWDNYLNTRMLVVASQHRSATRTPRLQTPGRADQSMLGPVSETPPLNFTPTMRSAKRRGINMNLY